MALFSNFEIDAKICHCNVTSSQHKLPSLQCTDEECIADLTVRKTTRLKYPGGCSLEFQSAMQILTERLLKWDIKSQRSTGQGVLGTIEAFGAADEEQGRKTLHRHWQIWTKELNIELRAALFDNDPNKKKQARETFRAIMDNIINANHNAKFVITHTHVSMKMKNQQ